MAVLLIGDGMSRWRVQSGAEVSGMASTREQGAAFSLEGTGAGRAGERWDGPPATGRGATRG